MAIMPMLRNNSDAFLRLGMGLLSGQTGPQQAALGLGGFADARATAKEKQDALQKQNMTIQFLRTVNPQLAQAVEAGAISAGDAYKTHLQSQQAKPNDFAQRAEAARQYGLDPNSDEGRSFILSGKYGGADGGGMEYGLNPQYGIDANGNPVLLQLSKGGTAKQTPLPDGISLSKQPIKMDAGTHFILLDPITRQPVGQIPKDNYGEAYDKGKGGAEGKAAGEAGGTYQSMLAKLPGLMQVVDRLGTLADEATYTYGGQGVDWAARQIGVTTEGAKARTEYMAMVDNQILPLLRDTFGAQFTVKEGESLRATLGAPNKSPAEKKAVLNAFIQQKIRDVQALGVQSGAVHQPGSAGVQQPMPNGNRTSSGVQWSFDP